MSTMSTLTLSTLFGRHRISQSQADSTEGSPSEESLSLLRGFRELKFRLHAERPKNS
jgi:hypothetical protein